MAPITEKANRAIPATNITGASRHQPNPQVTASGTAPDYDASPIHHGAGVAQGITAIALRPATSPTGPTCTSFDLGYRWPEDNTSTYEIGNL